MDALSAMALAVLIFGGWITGTQGLSIKPFIKPQAAVVRQAAVEVRYLCSPAVAASLATGQSHLDPNLFCARR